jgi:phage host-nuclease inhibitor protein Gam
MKEIIKEIERKYERLVERSREKGRLQALVDVHLSDIEEKDEQMDNLKAEIQSLFNKIRI